MHATRSATAIRSAWWNSSRRLAVAALLAGSFDQLVERRDGESALVGAAVGLEQQPQEVLGVGVARAASR